MSVELGLACASERILGRVRGVDLGLHGDNKGYAGVVVLLEIRVG